MDDWKMTVLLFKDMAEGAHPPTTAGAIAALEAEDYNSIHDEFCSWLKDGEVVQREWDPKVLTCVPP